MVFLRQYHLWISTIVSPWNTTTGVEVFHYSTGGFLREDKRVYTMKFIEPASSYSNGTGFKPQLFAHMLHEGLSFSSMIWNCVHGNTAIPDAKDGGEKECEMEGSQKTPKVAQIQPYENNLEFFMDALGIKVPLTEQQREMANCFQIGMDIIPFKNLLLANKDDDLHGVHFLAHKLDRCEGIGLHAGWNEDRSDVRISYMGADEKLEIHRKQDPDMLIRMDQAKAKKEEERKRKDPPQGKTVGTRKKRSKKSH